MSHVTTVVLISSDPDNVALDRFNQLLLEHRQHSALPPELAYIPSQYIQSTGTKVPQRSIATAGFNYLDNELFCRLFREAGFEDAVLVLGWEHGGHKTIQIGNQEEDLEW